MKHLKTLARTALVVFVSLVVGFNLYNWNAQSLTGNALPMPFGYGAAVVLTGSMEPEIMVDDLIIVQATDDYEIGEVVVYQTGHMLVVHRIVDMDAETVTTQGDANNVSDEPVALSQIKGEVIAHIPGIGVLVRFLKTPVVTIALVVGAVLSIELPYRKEKAEKDEELERIKAEIRRLKEEQEL